MQPIAAYQAANDYESDLLADYATGPIKWGAAVVGDLGTTIYNSIVPEQYETSTYDTLSSINSDLADFYSENKTSVELGSFVGGLVIPGLGVARAAKMASSGAGLFGGIGRISSLGYSAKKIEKYTKQAASLARTANGETAMMKQAIWKQRLWTAENAFAENVLFETAFYGLMNDHAYMDDYGLDTFALSTAIGTAFTTPIQLAIRNKSLKDAKQTAQIALRGKYGTSNIHAVDPKAVASHYDTGTALAGIQFTIDDLTNQVNKVVDPADVELRRFTLSLQKEQELAGQNMSISLLDMDAQKLSKEYIQPKNDTILGWNELRAEPFEINTPLQRVGAYVKKFPNALIGAERGGIGMAQETLPKVGVKEVAGKGNAVAEQIIADDGWLSAKPMTYDEATDFLGGDKFKANENIAHMYEWDGKIYQSDVIHGRLMRGAADAKAAIDPKYDMSGPSTYSPLTDSPIDTDLGFLNALNAMRSLQAVKGVVDGGDLHKLQAIAHAGYNAEVKVGGKVVSMGADQVVAQMKESKMQWIETLNIDGYDLHQISKYTNTPVETVEAVMQTGWNRGAMDKVKNGKDIRWVVYDNAGEEAFKKYLSPSLMTVKVTPRPSSPWQGAIQQDRDLLANVTKSAANAIASKSKSPLLRSIFAATAGKATNAALDQNIWQLYASGAGGSRWTSTDMYMRAWENINGTITTMGQDFQNIINHEGIIPMRKIMQPLAEGVAADGKVAIVNFEHLRNALDAIPAGKTAAGMFYDPATRKVVLSIDKKGNQTFLPIPGSKQDWHAEFDSVHHLVKDGVMRIGESMWNMRGTNAELTNTMLASKRGIHIPYDNISDDFVSYLFDPNNPKNIKRISGNNLAQMTEKVAKIEEQIAGTGLEIVPRSELDRVWNKLNDYSSLEYIQEANPEALKSGIASRDVTGSVDVLERMLKSYESDIIKQARIFQRGANSTVFDTLGQISRHHDALAQSGRMTDAQKTQMKLNPARLASKTLLNISKSGDVPLMDGANNATDIAVDWAGDVIGKGSKIIKTKLGLGQELTEADFDLVKQELANKNIPNPWKDFHEYVQASMPRDKKQAKATVSAGAQIMTLFNLRLLDSAHAIVTTLSAPALIMGEAATMGQSPMKHMMTVGKYFFSKNKPQRIQEIVDTMREKGYGARKTSEATSILTKAVGQKGFLKHLSDTDTKTLKQLYGVAKDEKSASAVGDVLYKGATSPSDLAEEFTREFAYLTGYEISKSKHPLAAAAVHEEAANLFTNRAMGNYSSRQRPTMFQGSFGQAMGLYQTFMFTVGQNLTRMVETKNTRALATFGGAYAGTFGLEALPFYNDINTMIGQYVDSPDGQDITQTVYEAFGNKYAGHEQTVGEYLLYGAPSALFQSAWYTRGDLDPRMPVESGRIQPPVVTALADVASNTYAAAMNVAKLSSVGAPMTDIGKAMVEGVMMQTMWRPAARLAELGMGYSVDRKGEILSQEEDVRNKWQPIFARITGARPLKEAVLRQQRYYNRLYDTTDTQRRRKSVRALRTHLRGDRDSGVVAGLMQDYLRDGGTPEGWGSVMHKTYLGTSQPFADKLLDQVRTQGGIADIVEGYGF